jgi:hypothetical protein
MSRASLLIVLASLISCGPPGRPPGDDRAPDDPPAVDAHVISYATITGRVWAPNQAPGQVPVDHEIPVAGALVYVTTNKPEPIPEGVYCEKCIGTPQGGVLTGSDGSFSLSVVPGRYYVVIQKGQFRVETEYELVEGTTQLIAQQTTLPSVWDPSNGKFMPRIALAPATPDRIEEILDKIGISTPEITIFEYAGNTAGTVTHLLSNLDEMRKFHIIFFPCSTEMHGLDGLLSNQAILANVRRYVSEGGKLYVTDWSGEVVDRAFPAQITLGDIGTDSEGTYDPVTLTGTLTTAGDADGAFYDLYDGKALDPELHAWIALQTGPVSSGRVVRYDPDRFEVTGLYNYIEAVDAVQIGTDPMGMPVYDQPKAWLTGSRPDDGIPRPIAVTYEPTGCGKVLYTAFQTATTSHSGLYLQERVLLYLIMEIAACSDSPVL